MKRLFLFALLLALPASASYSVFYANTNFDTQFGPQYGQKILVTPVFYSNSLAPLQPHMYSCGLSTDTYPAGFWISNMLSGRYLFTVQSTPQPTPRIFTIPDGTGNYTLSTADVVATPAGTGFPTFNDIVNYINARIAGSNYASANMVISNNAGLGTNTALYGATVYSNLTLASSSNLAMTVSVKTITNTYYPDPNSSYLLVQNLSEVTDNVFWSNATNGTTKVFTNVNRIRLIYDPTLDVSAGVLDDNVHVGVTNGGGAGGWLYEGDTITANSTLVQVNGSSINASIIQTNLVTEYVRHPALSLNGANAGTNAVLYVDPVFGDDGGGRRGFLTPWKTIVAATAAAVSNDVIFLLPGDFSDAGVTLPRGVSMVGSGRGVSKIHANGTGSVSFSGPATIKDFTIEGSTVNSFDGVIEGIDFRGSIDGIFGNFSAGAYVRYIDCSFTSCYDTVNAGASSLTNHALIDLYGCSFSVTNNGQGARGGAMILGSGLSVRMFGGSVECINFNGNNPISANGGGACFTISTNSTLELYGTRVSYPTTNASAQHAVYYTSAGGNSVTIYGGLFNTNDVVNGTVIVAWKDGSSWTNLQASAVAGAIAQSTHATNSDLASLALAAGTLTNASGLTNGLIPPARLAGSAGTSSVALGQSADSTKDYAVSVGAGANAFGTNSAAMGRSAAATASNASALGEGAQAGNADATAIGQSAVTTATNQIMLGLANGTVNVPGSLVASGASLTNLNASQLATGTVPSARLSLTSNDIPLLDAKKLVTGTLNSAQAGSISNHSDVKITGTAPTIRDMLIWDGSNWTNAPSMGYTIDLFDTGNNSMAANTTYYYGKMSARLVNTVYGIAQVDIPRAGRITRVQYKDDISGTLGSGEVVNFWIEVNNATDVFNWQFAMTAPFTNNVVTGSQVVAVGDTIAFKVTTPAAWATPAVSVRLAAQVYIEP